MPKTSRPSVKWEYLTPLSLFLLLSCEPVTTSPDGGGPSDHPAASDLASSRDRAASADLATGDLTTSVDATPPRDTGPSPDRHSAFDAGVDAAPALDAAPPDTAAPDTEGTDATAPDSSRPDTAQPDTAGPLFGLPYPTRDPYRIKAVQPDFWPNIDELVSHNTGGVAMNMVWDVWEPSLTPPPCAGGFQEYDGHCFQISQANDQAIAAWTERGVVVTGIVYGVPRWARPGNTGCSPINPAFERFCTPDNPADYGRFAGMLAMRYDGLHGHGRIADFVIHNEVNANDWFDIGCGQGVPCDVNAWIQTYVDNYAHAYDRIKTHQSEAKVLLSFEHHFDTEFDLPANDHPLISVKTFVTGFAERIGDRAWQIAFHPYAPNLFSPEFSPYDLPKVTYGNPGVLLGWLRATFPDKPHAWKVQFTESGINSAPPQSSEEAQVTAVCDSLRNTLATPGVTNYIYHRLRDHPDEGGLQLGLIRADDTYKPAWAKWALCNKPETQPDQLDCGFEDLPYTRLTRGVRAPYAGATLHWTSSRILPDDYTAESSWRLLREFEPGTTLLFECQVDSSLWGPHNLLTPDPGCEGLQTQGPVGYIWDAPFEGSVPLYRCMHDPPLDHFVSTDPACEGSTPERLLGYAREQ